MSGQDGRRRDLAALPKAHLHLHFTGSMRPSTLVELADERGIRLPRSLTDDVALQVEPTRRGWFRFQRQYDAARAVVDSEAAMRRILHEAAEDDAAEGSGRLELQVDPTSYAPFAGGLTPAIEIVLDQAAISERETGVSIGIVLAASRTRHPLDARTLARLAARHAGPVVGFGLSNDERRGTTAEFGPAFRIAREAGLLSVPHGGELLGPAHVQDVLAHLHPHRLGHGVRAAEDPHLLERVVAAGVGLEVCPASNASLGVVRDPGEVPLRRLLDAGAQIALGADDPLLFGSRLLDQYATARAMGLDDEELAGLAASSIRISAAPPAVARRLLAGVRDWLGTPPSADGADDASAPAGRAGGR
ncbi:adenosine deaminase [Brachybacterium saurashtrense]|uniref:Adenosine deaminase n=1 Tax=Brachybacterium saurashtrense TaxID=556288 RepID=A0A345YPG8_9MICO|nr:adenosine deaminase [Brachybacterium saurashtrense]AXK45820.1 adenosine deaminase [Brachybacterium saurashtrense]RRR24839.1 adenosine deaminase [Brachybacterium saurashtrense]